VNKDKRTTHLAVVIGAAMLATGCGGSTESAATERSPTSVDSEPPISEAADIATELDGTESTTPETTAAPVTTPPTTMASETTTPTTAAPETTAVPETTAPETTAAPATTVAPLDLTLRADAIGGLVFGATTPDQLLNTLAPVLGNAVSIEPIAYPDEQLGYADEQPFSPPIYENTIEEKGFAFPFGNDICFRNGLCAYFGGQAPDALALVGYSQTEGSATLTTASGVTAGSEGPMFADVIEPSAGGCYNIGEGTADGVPLILQSTGVAFGTFDNVTDKYISQAPPVSDVFVLIVGAGEEPFFLYDDC